MEVMSRVLRLQYRDAMGRVMNAAPLGHSTKTEVNHQRNQTCANGEDPFIPLSSLDRFGIMPHAFFHHSGVNSFAE